VLTEELPTGGGNEGVSGLKIVQDGPHGTGGSQVCDRWVYCLMQSVSGCRVCVRPGEEEMCVDTGFAVRPCIWAGHQGAVK
jgi:hypothetical protein